MTLDADLQDDPHEIPRFLAEMEKDLDVVSGWKKVRHDPWHKVLPSRVFNWMVSRLTGVRAARPQLRHEVLSPRDASTKCGSTASCTASCRCWPRRAASASANWSSTTGREVRPLEVRRAPLRQGLSRPADGEVPHRLRPAPAARAGNDRAGVVPVRAAWGWSYLAVTGSSAAQLHPDWHCCRCTSAPADAISLDASAAAGRAIDVDRLPGRADHRLPGPRRRHLFDRRTKRPPRRAHPSDDAEREAGPTNPPGTLRGSAGASISC